MLIELFDEHLLPIDPDLSDRFKVLVAHEIIKRWIWELVAVDQELSRWREMGARGGETVTLSRAVGEAVEAIVGDEDPLKAETKKRLAESAPEEGGWNALLGIASNKRKAGGGAGGRGSKARKCAS